MRQALAPFLLNYERRKMKLASLFDGSGGFPLAAIRAGITPVWASEVEPFAIAVTRQNIPSMAHLGTVTDIDGAKVEPVDVITFGSPCQDLSICGARAGLDGDRSGLFFQACRIIREMREATNGRYPRYAIWENVLGALSSNEGRDFERVLLEFMAISGRNSMAGFNGVWRRAGAIIDRGFSLAWRVLDARYWGVPQRRRRIFLVADFGGRRAPEILFKRAGGARSVDKMQTQGESDSAGSGTGASEDSGKPSDGLTTRFNSSSAIACSHVTFYTKFETNLSPTLLADSGDSHPTIVYSTSKSGRYTQFDQDIAGTVAAGDARSQAQIVYSSSKSSFYTKHATNVASALLADDGDHNMQMIFKQNEGRLRYMTPTEYARLQGFPDNWAKVKPIPETEFFYWRAVWTQYAEVFGKRPKKDNEVLKWMSAPYKGADEYRLYGNGVALPCVQYIMDNLREGEKPE